MIPSPYTYLPYVLTSQDISYATQYDVFDGCYFLNNYSIGVGNVCESYGYFW